MVGEFSLAPILGGWYTDVMQKRDFKKGLQIFVIMGSVVAWSGASLFAGVTAGVFGGFTHHISEQIMKDKVKFAEAENCTVWHYQQLKKIVFEKKEIFPVFNWSLFSKMPDRENNDIVLLVREVDGLQLTPPVDLMLSA